MFNFKFKLGSKKYCSTSIFVIFLTCVSASVIPRHNFDLDAAAAEPRPIFIHSGPSAEALPLVYTVDTTAGPLLDASEKVEKVLRPALAFAYNQKHDEYDGETAETNHKDQKPEAVDYYKYVEGEEKKESADKEDDDDDHGEEAGEQSAESQHHGQHHEEGGGKDHGAEFEKGVGKDFHAHHHGEHGEKGDKGYKGHHHHEKGQKGHHDKEDHKKQYDEGGGQEKDHHHEDGYHGEYHKDHHGKKGSKYSEEGEHSKGHNTKGSHNIHKKDEFDKKTEFFEEEYEGGESEKHGGFSHEDEYHKGGHEKGGYDKGGHHKDHYGKKGESSKGGFFKEGKGHDEKGGHDKHYEHESKHGKKEGQNTGKKWGYKESSGNGGGDGHGDGAHSHQSYAVQEPPEKEQAAEASPVKTYDIPPIVPFVLPLEGEDGESDRRHQIQGAKGDDGDRASSQIIKTVKYNEKKLSKRRPTPTDDFLADSPFSPATANEDGELKQEHQVQRAKSQLQYKEPKLKRRPSPTDDFLADSPFSPATARTSVAANEDGELKQQHHQIQRAKGNDGDKASSQLIKTVQYKEPKPSKRRPSPTDDFLADSPFSSATAKKPVAARANGGDEVQTEVENKRGDDGDGNLSELKTVAYREPKLSKRRPTPTDDFLADSPFSSATAKKPVAARANEQPEIILPSTSVPPINPLSTVEQQTGEPPKLKPVEPQKTNKKRRLKKRKLQKEAKPLKTGQVATCPFSHNIESHVPEETSHSFVIVAADGSE